MRPILVAVNGTLMRGLELNPNLLRAGGVFAREAITAPCYRLWSIDDRYPAMVRVRTGGAAIDVELWTVPAGGVVSVLLNEPAGLTLGKVILSAQEEVLGILGEPALCEGYSEITRFGGWRQYIAAPRHG